MAEELRIEVLGGLRMTLGEVPVRGFVSSKAPALLAYLVVTARPHFRAALAPCCGANWATPPPG